MNSDGSITKAIQQARDGDSLALQRLWEQYFDRLVRLARERLPGRNRRAADEEDVALSAFHSFVDGLRQGRFPRLADRDELWKLLICLTHRKATRHRQYADRAKRGGGKVSGESALLGQPGDDDRLAGIADVMGEAPTPQFLAQVEEEFQNRMASLPNNEFRELALLKFQGYQNLEIAAKLGCSLRHVERRLKIIRETWQETDEP